MPRHGHNNQEGAITVILLLAQLVNAWSFMEHPLFAMATKLSTPANILPSVDCETDFVAIPPGFSHEGRIRICIGEGKGSGEISEDDVRKMKSVVDALKDRFDVYVIFAKLSEFTPEEIARSSALNERYYNRLILLTARELESWHIYDDTAKEYVLDRHGTTIEDMALITQHIYYGNPQKRTSSATYD